MGRKRILKKKELLEAIQGSYGIISTIAARLHCNWHTVDETIKLYPECMQALADENESILDFTEGKAIERIKEGDGTMIRFMLATKGKKRGYTYEDNPVTRINRVSRRIKGTQRRRRGKDYKKH